MQCSAQQIVLKNIVTIQISPTIEVSTNHSFQGAKGVMYSFPRVGGSKYGRNEEGFIDKVVFKLLYEE